MACLISKDAQNQVSFKNAGALIYIMGENIPCRNTPAIWTSKETVLRKLRESRNYFPGEGYPL